MTPALGANPSRDANSSHRASSGGGEPWTRRWTRRGLTLPLYFLLLGAMIVGLPGLLLLAAVADRLRRSPWLAVRCVLFFVFYLACEVGGILVSGALWLRRLVVGRKDWEERNFRLQGWWARTLLAGAMRIFRMSLEAEVPATLGQGPILLFIRHTSVGDTILPAVLLSSRFGLRLRYVLKRELLWDPCLDIVGNRLPNYFVRRGSGDSEREVRGVLGLLENLGPRDGVLIYPEGTRFTPSKRQRALEKIASGKSPELLPLAAAMEHVLPPRLGGVLGLLENNPGADVVFCVHTGFEGAATFADLLSAQLVGARIRVEFRRVPFAEIPRDRAALQAWLFEEWGRVDRWVAENARPAARTK